MSSECFSLFFNFNRVQTVLVKAIQLIYQLRKHLNVGIVARQDTINKPVFDNPQKFTTARLLYCGFLTR